MKIKLILLGLAALSSYVSATTITATGTPNFFTSAGSILTNTNSTFQTGLWNGTTWTQFGANDASPIAISTVAALAGRWSGGFTDNNNTTASPFNGLAVWFRVTTTADGGGIAYFSGTPVFPNANGGVADSLTYNSNSLSIVGQGSTAGTRAFSAVDTRVIIGVIPEPSAALLGALGFLGLLRRRRN